MFHFNPFPHLSVKRFAFLGGGSLLALVCFLLPPANAESEVPDSASVIQTSGMDPSRLPGPNASKGRPLLKMPRRGEPSAPRLSKSSMSG